MLISTTLGGTDHNKEGVRDWADKPEAGRLIEFVRWTDGEPGDLNHWTGREGVLSSSSLIDTCR